MASAEAGVSSSPSSSGKLENLSKEELIKFAKKQTILLSKCRAQVEDLSKKNDAQSHMYASNIEDLQLKNDALSSKKEELQRDLDECVSDLTKVTSRLTECENEKSMAIEVYQSMQASLDELSNKNLNLSEENDCLRSQHKSIIDSVKSLQEENEKLCSEQRKISEEHTRVEQELVSANRLKEKLAVSYKGLKQKYLELQQNTSQPIKRSETETDELRKFTEKIEMLEKELERKNFEIEENLRQHGDVKEQFSSHIDMLTKQKEELVEKVTQLSHQVESMKHLTSQDNQQGKIEQLQKDLDELNKLYSDSKVRVEELVIGLGSESARLIAEYTEENLRLSQVNQRLQQEQSRKQSDHQSTSVEDVVSLDEKLQTLTLAVQQLEKENSDMKRMLEAETVARKEAESNLMEKTANYEIVLKKVSDMDDLNERLRGHTDRLVESLEDRDRVIAGFERRFQFDSRNAQVLQQQFQEHENVLNEQLAHFHQQRDEMFNQLTNYRTQLQNLTDSLEPIKERDREGTMAVFNALKILLEAAGKPCGDWKVTPETGIPELAAVLIDAAQRFKEHMRMTIEFAKNEKLRYELTKSTLEQLKAKFEEVKSENAKLKKEVASVKGQEYVADDEAGKCLMKPEMTEETRDEDLAKVLAFMNRGDNSHNSIDSQSLVTHPSHNHAPIEEEQTSELENHSTEASNLLHENKSKLSIEASHSEHQDMADHLVPSVKSFNDANVQDVVEEVIIVENVTSVEAENYKHQIEELHKELLLKDEVALKNEKRLQEYESELEQLRKNCEECHNHTKELVRLAELTSKLQSEIEESARVMQKLTSEHSDLQSELKELRTANNDLLAESLSLKAENASSTAQIDSLNKYLLSQGDKEVQLQKAQAEIEKLLSNLADANLVNSDMTHQHNSEVAKLNMVIENLTQEKESIEVVYKKIVDTEKTGQQEIMRLEKEKNDLQENLNRRSEEIENMIKLVTEERDSKSQLHDMYTTLQGECSSLRDSLDVYSSANVQQESDLEELRKTYSCSVTEIDNLKAEVSRLTISNSELVSVYEPANKERSALLEQVEKLNADMKSLLETSGKASSERDSLYLTNSNLASENESLKTQIYDITVQLTNLKVLHSESIETWNSEKLALEDQMKVLENEIITSKTLQQDAASLLETMREDNTCTNNLLMKQLQDLQMDYSRVALHNSELVAELDGLRKELMETSISSRTSAEESPSIDSAAKIKELDEKCSKFKALAIKSKKDLMESRALSDKIKQELQEKLSQKVTEMQTLVNNMQSLQRECDKLQDDLENEKSTTSSLSQIQARFNSVLEEKENLQHTSNQLNNKVKILEGQQSESKQKLSTLEKEVEAKQIEITELLKDINRQKETMKMLEMNHAASVEKLKSRILELELKVKDAQDELVLAHKTVNKSSLMDLEIADFEKTVTRLQVEIGDKEEVIKTLEKELEHSRLKVTSLESQLVSADEQIESGERKRQSMQVTLDAIKRELETSQSLTVEQKNAQTVIRTEQEALQLQFEDLKLEAAKMASERLLAQEQLKAAQDSNQRLTRTLENKLRTLQTDLESSRSECALLQQDYDSYKVRVHSVLKQQQTKAAVEAAYESEKTEKEHLQQVLEQIKVKHRETSDRLVASLSENSLLQDELDKLSLKHNKFIQESSHKEAVLRQRVDQLMSENSVLATEHTAVLNQMTQQNEVITQSYKDQLQTCSADYQTQLTNLSSEITLLRKERTTLTNELNALKQQIGTAGKSEQKALKNSHNLSLPIFSSGADVSTLARESGEGMEHPSSVRSNVSQPVLSPNTLHGLEQLISNDNDDAISITSSTQIPSSDGPDEAGLKNQLKSSEKQVEHLRELLNDSEATCMRYNEQVKILKQEIRRLESNQQRENSISNMEYLKNVIYKFVSSEASYEKSQLLPVLNTMLKFTDQELATLKAFASEGSTAAQPSTSGQGQSSGWSGYLHRWTGFSS